MCVCVCVCVFPPVESALVGSLESPGTRVVCPSRRERQQKLVPWLAAERERERETEGERDIEGGQEIESSERFRLIG